MFSIWGRGTFGGGYSCNSYGAWTLHIKLPSCGVKEAEQEVAKQCFKALPGIRKTVYGYFSKTLMQAPIYEHIQPVPMFTDARMLNFKRCDSSPISASGSGRMLFLGCRGLRCVG